MGARSRVRVRALVRKGVHERASAKRVRGAPLGSNGLPVGAVTNRLAVKVGDLRQRRGGFGVKSACWPSCARVAVTNRRPFVPGCTWLRAVVAGNWYLCV